MNRHEIHIPRKLTNQLLHLAQLSPNVEICGLVGGKNGAPCTCYPVDNVANHPEQRFLLDPKQQIAAMADMRNQGEELFAIYHSHPTSPAVPSAIDLEQAAYPDALYLIISLNTQGLLEMRGFQIDSRKAVEIPLTLGED
ncbi:MAG: Mov34/MPN/PAD-1 family protein [Gammaproteobacteria bacterium]